MEDILYVPNNHTYQSIYLANTTILTKQPCIGDLLFTPQVTPSGGWNYAGGQYGMTRDNGRKFHDGIDISATVGIDLYLTHTGGVTEIVNSFDHQYVRNSYGNYVKIEFDLSEGNKYQIMFGHLKSIDPTIQVGKSYSVWNLFGKSGVSGNAGVKPGELETDLIPRVHIRARENSKSIDPAKLLSTEFDKSTGKPLNPNPCGK